MLLSDQPATVMWVEASPMQSRTTGDKVLPDSRIKDFESVRSALQFIMETLSATSRSTAQIRTEGAMLYQADIEAMYAQLKQA